MAQVLPAFYDSFTRGRKDAIDFQNLITAQKQNAQLFPQELRRITSYADIAGNQARDTGMTVDTRAMHLPQEQANEGARLGVEGNKLRAQQGFYGYGFDEINKLDPSVRFGAYANMLSPESIGDNFRNPKVTPPGNQAQGPYDPSNLYNIDPAARAGDMPGYYMNMFGPSGQGTPAQTQPYEPAVDYGGDGRVRDLRAVPYLNQPGTLQSFTDNMEQWNKPQAPTPETAVQQITAAGLDPTLAQYSVQIDQERGLPIGTTAAIAMAESNFNLDAASPKGARGLMQIMPDNFEFYGGPTFDPGNGQASMSVANKLLAERQRAFPESSVEELLRRYNGRMDLDYTGKDPKAYKENVEYPGRVRATYQKLFNFSPNF